LAIKRSDFICTNSVSLTGIIMKLKKAKEMGAGASVRCLTDNIFMDVNTNAR